MICACIINYVIFNSGALAFDKRSGFWAVSSVPRFPAQVRDEPTNLVWTNGFLQDENLK